jgi:CubicO group peptidase (beta-lactamase class C family)
MRERAEELVDDHAILGMAIGIVDGERITKIEAGNIAVGGATPNGETLFEIGSISKAFTGILLADAVVRGEVTLNEPVAKLLGSQVRVPKFEGRPIRLEDLATHTSGLPRLPANLRFINPLNPYAHYQREQLEAFLAEYQLARRPGKEYDYSNFGMGLLGYALAERAGKTYQQLLVERICRPLRLPDTRVNLSKNQQARLATGISPLGLPTMNWDFPTLAGAGGIRSTLDVMLVFLQANMHPGKTPLAKAIRLSHKPRFVVHAPTEKSPRKVEIGLGWHINTTPEGMRIVWHNGMTGGYASYVGFVPEKKIGIVVLGNTATGKLDDFAVRSLKRLAEAKQVKPLVLAPREHQAVGGK